MTKQALIDLRDKVAAGNLTQNYCLCSHVHGVPLTATIWEIYEKGSLDAAVAFLEAVLPDAEWQVEGLGWAVIWNNKKRLEVHSTTPARALLLATLEVLIEEAE